MKSIIALTLISQVVSYPLFFPSRLQGWHDVKLDTLMCPSYASELNREAAWPQIGLRHLAATDHYEVKGTICHKTTWVKTCDFRWYGPKYITTKISYALATGPECQQAVDKASKDELETPYMPEANCNWATISDNEETFIIVKKSNIFMDPYNMVYVGTILKGGECASTVCPLEMHGGVWIPSESPRESCKLGNSIISHINPNDASRLVTEASYLVTEYRRQLPFLGACMMSMCGEVGIRFKSGEWYKIESDDGRVLSFLDSVPMCNGELTVSVHDSSATYHNLNQEILDLSAQIACISELRRAKEKNAVSNYLLSFLTPNHGGFGTAYRVLIGQLQASKATYARVKLGDLPTATKWGQLDDGSTYSSEDVTGEIFNGPLFNGNRMDNGTLRVVQNAILGQTLEDEDLYEHSAKEILHPHLTVLSSNESDVLSAFRPVGAQGDIIHAVGEWVGNGVSGFIHTIVYLVIFCGIIFLLYRCLPYFLKKRKSKSTSQMTPQMIPLQQYQFVP
nr:glycoprotein [Snakehead vesiculovirus]